MRGHTECSPQSYRPHLLTLPLCVYSPVVSYNKIKSFIRTALESLSANATGMLAKFKVDPFPIATQVRELSLQVYKNPR